ncbi:FadR/GntR family transcriptional regulator [Amycolatopsis thermoflava]|uniref:FadR/GntR family transcriptional regulator n=1 Tax=Amycolatopsis thermoflava TaxID=84480 RepID=UPI0006891D26|nr:FadR/GntR family transcriptional regulator [Amycolatopsis thermoflava]
MPDNRRGVTTAGRRLEEELRQQILTGVLSPGDRLPSEPELSSHYQVSRNTAREALRALSSQGLLVVKRGIGGGIFVAVPEAEHVSSTLLASLTLRAQSADLSVAALVEVRELLEVPAAELAALRRTDEDLEEVRRALFTSREVDPKTVFASTRAFHLAILKAAHNPLLEILAGPVFQVLNDRFVREKTPASVWHDIDQEHREILGYLEARDQVGAREATRAHLRAARSLYTHMQSRSTAPTQQ